jgi:acetyl-CoA synthetase
VQGTGARNERSPGSATVPFFGIKPIILDPTTGKVRVALRCDAVEVGVSEHCLQELEGNNVEGVLAIKWPWLSLARAIYQDHQRYLETYMKP